MSSGPRLSPQPPLTHSSSLLRSSDTGLISVPQSDRLPSDTGPLSTPFSPSGRLLSPEHSFPWLTEISFLTSPYHHFLGEIFLKFLTMENLPVTHTSSQLQVYMYVYDSSPIMQSLSLHYKLPANRTQICLSSPCHPWHSEQCTVERFRIYSHSYSWTT